MTTKTDTKLAWEAVGDRLESLGLKLKIHFEQAEPGKPPAGEVGDAFRQLGAAIEATFSAIGTAVQDPAVRQDASDLATALGDAMADSLTEAGQELAEAANGLRCGKSAAAGKAPEPPMPADQ